MKEKLVIKSRKGNPKAFWKYVNNKRKCKVTIPSLYEFCKNDELVENGVDKTDTLVSPVFMNLVNRMN